MIEGDTVTKEELLLHDEDFPGNHVHMAHPDDYKEVLEFIMHSRLNRHNRLIVRAAWLVPNGGMVPMSFVCDTGTPSHIYLSSKAMSTLQEKGHSLACYEI